MNNRTDEKGAVLVELSLVVGTCVFFVMICWNILFFARAFHALNFAALRAGENMDAVVALETGTFRAQAGGQTCTTAGNSPAHRLIQEQLANDIAGSLRILTLPRLCIETAVTVTGSERISTVRVTGGDFTFFPLPFFDKVTIVHETKR